VACTDINDSGTGKALLESAAPLLAKDGVCTPATLKCDGTLKSGKTIMERLGLNKPPKVSPWATVFTLR